MITFKLLYPGMTAEHLGFIPLFFSEDDPRPAKEQLDENYAHGGGWRPMEKWKHIGVHRIQYPGDEPLEPVAEAHLRDETICLYEGAWVAIFHKDGSFEVSRCD